MVPLALFLLTAIYYGGYVLPQWSHYRYTTWDALRDEIGARHLLNGGAWGADPVFDGFSCWYPPFHALALATASKLFSADLTWVYAVSAGFNSFAIVAFYFLAYWFCQRNPYAALASTLALTSLPWFVTYVMASPTVFAHATVLSLIFLALFSRFLESNSLWAVCLASIFLGLMGLLHPPTFLILSGIFFLFYFHCIYHEQPIITHIRRFLVFLILTFGLSSPYWLLNLLQPVHNMEPVRYIAPALYHWEFVLPGKSPWRFIPILLFAGMGFWTLTREWKKLPNVFFLCLLGISIAGQVPVYVLVVLQRVHPSIAAALEPYFPILVPHEFQLYTQLSVVLLAGLGIAASMTMQGRTIYFQIGRNVLLMAFAVSLLFSLAEVPRHSRLFLWPDREEREWDGLVQTLLEKTNIQDVICTPDDHTSFFIIGVRTGRKCLLSYASHVNTHAELKPRKEARDAIYKNGSRLEIAEYTTAFSVNYILCTRKSISQERIRLFRSWYPVLYDDDMITLFQIP